MAYKTKHDQLKTEISILKSDLNILSTALSDCRELCMAGIDNDINTNTVFRSIVMLTLQAQRWVDTENE